MEGKSRTRRCKRPDYEAARQARIQLGDALAMNHLARFGVDGVAQGDMRSIDAGYAPVGGEASAPDILLGLLFDGYATGGCSARQIEKGTSESIPLRCIARGQHPDPATLAHFRQAFGAAIQDGVVPVL